MPPLDLQLSWTPLNDSRAAITAHRHMNLKLPTISKPKAFRLILQPHPMVFHIQGMPVTRTVSVPNLPLPFPRFHPMFYGDDSGNVSEPSAITVRLEPMRVRYLQISIVASTSRCQRSSAIRAGKQQHMCELFAQCHIILLRDSSLGGSLGGYPLSPSRSSCRDCHSMIVNPAHSQGRAATLRPCI